jgi:hypothetical protein
MKHIIPTFLAIGALGLAPAIAQDCVNADPWLELGGVGGDFELRVDPQDPKQNLIFVANVADGASGIAAARINGASGQVMRGSLTSIADNYYGQSVINGPEFVQKPTGELGVVYAGPGGVHAVFRSTAPTPWNAFWFNADGKRIFGSPPPLPSTSDGAYPAPPIPAGQRTYGQYRGSCLGICYGWLDDGVATDVRAVLAASGAVVYRAAQSPTDGYIFISACNAVGSCGIYEALIDGAGGFVPNTLQKLAGTGLVAPVSLVASRHPVTGSTVLFSNRGSTAIDVWEQSTDGGPLRLVKRVQAPSDIHFRSEVDAEHVVLNLLARTGGNAGSYTIPVGASAGGLDVGLAKKISGSNGGPELVWMPAAGKWAVFYRTSGDSILRRCWITP